MYFTECSPNTGNTPSQSDREFGYLDILRPVKRLTFSERNNLQHDKTAFSETTLKMLTGPQNQDCCCIFCNDFTLTTFKALGHYF